MKCKKLCSIIEGSYPLNLCEDYDNVGLLIGRYDKEISKALISLEVTPRVINEAIENNVDIIIVHHPLIFKPLKKISDRGYIESMVLTLIENKIALYASHTNFDSAKSGMNDILSEKLNLNNVSTLEQKEGIEEGIGRVGTLDRPLAFRDFYISLKSEFNLSGVIVSGDDTKIINKVAVVGGSGADLIRIAMKKGCDCIVTGDVKHHIALDFVNQGMCIVDLTHFGSEIIFKEHFRKFIEENTEIEVILSSSEENPLRIV
ncbi:MAG: Nif3-like dinuclear metal center hexameric protein [Clostridium sp.]